MARRSLQTVRVIAGSYKGRRLKYPDGGAARPTMQRARASVFETIKERLPGSVFADLYCAAGGVGIEALSRGAAFVHFVEKDRQQLAALRDNLELCRIPAESIRIHSMDVHQALSEPLGDVQVVFADPPYDEEDLPSLLAHFDSTRYPHLELLVIEHRGTLAAEAHGGLRVVKRSRFGDSRITYLEPS